MVGSDWSRHIIDQTRLFQIAKECISCKSEVPDGSDREMSQYVYSFLDRLGWQPWKQECGEGRFNVLARLPGEEKGAIMYCGHLDVVPAEQKGWLNPPYEPEIRGDALYGRGASDMKGSVACMLYLAELAAQGKLKPRKTLFLFFDVDEENHNLGIKTFLKSPVKPDFIVVGEPTSLELAMGHRGVMAFTVTITGKSAHAAQPKYGVNPIRAAMLLQQKLELYKKELEKRNVCYQGISSMEITMIQAGTKVNVIPGQCEIRIDRRLTDGENRGNAEKELEKLLIEVERESGCSCVYAVTTYCPPGLCNESHPMIGRIRQCVQVITGSPSVLKAFEASGEAGLLIESLEVPTITFGPGDIRQAHTVNEYITLKQLVWGALAYGKLFFREASHQEVHDNGI